MSVIEYILSTVIILLLIYTVFSLGRLYECCVAIRELDDKLDQALFENEMAKQESSVLKRVLREEGVIE